MAARPDGITPNPRPSMKIKSCLSFRGSGESRIKVEITKGLFGREAAETGKQRITPGSSIRTRRGFCLLFL